MTRRPTRLCLSGVVAVLLAGLASAPALAHPSGCTFRVLQYALTAVKLHERIAAGWSYGTPDLEDRAQLQTVQIAASDWHGHTRNAAVFYELSGQCRIGDWHQGGVRAAVGVPTHVDGTWSAGQRSGICTHDRVVSRSLPIEFVRQTLALDPPAPSIGVKWTFPQPPVLDCPFTSFDPHWNEYHTAHLRFAEFHYAPVTYVVPKSVLLGASKVVHLRVHLRAHAHPVNGGLAPWDDGKVSASFELTATVTLERSSDCTTHLGSPAQNSRC